MARCRDLLTALNGKLLEFDFRNGALRRKYDGVKWGVRRMEDLLYELSVVGVLPRVGGDDAAAAAAAAGSIVPLEELEAIRQRLAQYDETREAVIKVSDDLRKGREGKGREERDVGADWADVATDRLTPPQTNPSGRAGRAEEQQERRLLRPPGRLRQGQGAAGRRQVSPSVSRSCSDGARPLFF